MSAARDPCDYDTAPRQVRRLTVVAEERGDTKPSARVTERDADALPDESEPTSIVAHGPLLAVSGLCGGAGTSTVAYLLASYVARRVWCGPALRPRR